MKKKGIKKEESDKKQQDLNEKILELRDSVLEEFDMIELIEDSIKDVFDCDLNCATCSREEQGKCMQGFKKANLYWLRKIAQDEHMLKDIVEKLDGMRETLQQMMKETTKYVEQHRTPDEKFKEHAEAVKQKVKESGEFGYFS